MQNSDIHSIVILEGPPKTHIVVVVNAVHVSHDDGATWKSFDAAEAFGLRYSRYRAGSARLQPRFPPRWGRDPGNHHQDLALARLGGVVAPLLAESEIRLWWWPKYVRP